MVKVKPLEEIKARYKEAAGVIPARYRRAIRRVVGWKERATSDDAEALYGARLTEAIAAKRRQKALLRVDEADWKRRAEEIGGAIIGTKVAKSVDKHAEGFSPYREALEAVELPPKEVDPMVNIDNRLKAVVSALVEKKKELKG